ncbi:fibronectin type III domain-containing protein [Clostridium formicaceticum]|nr:fibronectin type III domain-containing protein [Clostridium formicaceticum]
MRSVIGYCTQNSPIPTGVFDEITENGSYRLLLRATGGANYTQTAQFNVVGVPVQTNILFPRNNYIGDTLEIEVEAFGGDGISYVNFYNSQLGTKVAYPPSSKLSVPYRVTFDTSSLSYGIHEFLIRAYDINGNRSELKTFTAIKHNFNLNFYATGTNTAYGYWTGTPNTTSYQIELTPTTGGTPLTYSTVNTSITTLGLSAGTTYRARVRAFTTGGYTGWSSIVEFTTNYITPTVPTGLTFNLTGQTTATASWNSVLGASIYRVQFISPYDVKNYTTSSTSYNFSNLELGEYHYVRVSAENANGDFSGWTDWVDVLTVPPTLTGLRLTNIDANSISIAWDESKSTVWYDIYVNNVLNGSVQGLLNYTVNLLQPNTSYTIRVIPRNDSGSGGYQQIVVTTTTGRPQNWTWFNIEMMYFTNGYPTTNILHTRWNELVDRINQFALYRTNMGYPTTQLSDSNKMTINDKKVYAYKFRNIANKLHEMSNAVSDEVRNVQFNDKVLGWYFMHLAQAFPYIP